jgi:hypothetical protein
MPAYLVRVIHTNDLVGFFVADEPDDLLLIIDECVDPSLCEYSELPPGGIYWESRSVPVPIEWETEDPTEPDPMPWAEASLSGSWEGRIYGWPENDVVWTAFDN